LVVFRGEDARGVGRRRGAAFFHVGVGVGGVEGGIEFGGEEGEEEVEEVDAEGVGDCGREGLVSRCECRFAGCRKSMKGVWLLKGLR